jgi:hypothetical protein
MNQVVADVGLSGPIGFIESIARGRLGEGRGKSFAGGFFGGHDKVLKSVATDVICFNAERTPHSLA